MTSTSKIIAVILLSSLVGESYSATYILPYDSNRTWPAGYITPPDDLYLNGVRTTASAAFRSGGSNGIGVGNNYQIDTGESVSFEFDSGSASAVKFRLKSANKPGSSSQGEYDVIGYGVGGGLLGTVAQVGPGLIDASSLFGNAPLSKLTVRSSFDTTLSLVDLHYNQAPSSGPTVLDFRVNDHYMQNGYDVFDMNTVTVTGSDESGPRRIALGISGGGVGVRGSGSDYIINEGQTVTFDFQGRVVSDLVTYFGGGSGKSGVAVASRTIEAFDYDGQSLGTVQESLTGFDSISDLFGGTPISSFSVTSDPGASASLVALSFNNAVTIPEPTSLVALVCLGAIAASCGSRR